MCDTLVYFNAKNPHHSFFAKNSDREPGELQILELSRNPQAEFESRPYFENNPQYSNTSFAKLKQIFNLFNNNYQTIISRPAWMWGAEMGVNQFGVAIGNEAVFSKEKVPADGLLGMDILRLALHNSRNAAEAKDFIINLIEIYDQGGNGGYKKSFKYHNSFLIKDFDEAYLLETSGKHWAVKKITNSANISNCYSITNDFELADEESLSLKNFKDKYENKLMTFLARGNTRKNLVNKYLSQTSVGIEQVKKILRAHHSGYNNDLRRGMGSLCIHSSYFIKCETTASMIVEYINQHWVVWVTAAPHPCVSLYRPVFLNSSDQNFDLNNANFIVDYARKWEKQAKKFVAQYAYFREEIKPLRDAVEAHMTQIIYKDLNTKTTEALAKDGAQCIKMAEDYYLDC